MQSRLTFFVRKIIHDLAVLFAVVIIAFAVLLSVARALSPFLSKHKSDIAAWASQALGQPVEISDAQLVWHHFEPVLRLQHVTLMDNINYQPILSIAQLDLGLNLWRTLLNRHVELGLLGISNMHISLIHEPGKTLYISGIKPIFSFNLAQSKPGQIIPFVSDIFSIDRIYLKHIQIDDETPQGQIETFWLEEAKLKNQYYSHPFAGTVFLTSHGPPSIFKVMGNFSGSQNFYSNLQGEIYFNTQNCSVRQISYLILQSAFIQQDSKTVSDLLTKWSGLIQSRAWVHFKNGALEKLTLQLNSPQLFYLEHPLALNANNNRKIPSQPRHRMAGIPTNFNTILQWQKDKMGHWFLIMNPFYFSFNQKPAFNSQIMIKGQNLSIIDINARTLPIAPFFDAFTKLFTLQLPPKLRAWSQFNPSGEIHDFLWHENPNQPNDLIISGHFRNIAWNSFQNIPSVSNLDGDFEISPRQGSINIQALRPMWYHPKWYSHPLQPYLWKTHLIWYPTLDQHLMLENTFGYWPTPQSLIRGNFELLWNEKNFPILGRLEAEHLKTNDIISLIPDKQTNAKLLSWLKQALQSGEMSHGDMILVGLSKNFPFVQHDGLFNAKLMMKNIHLHYDPKWPDITHLSGLLNFIGPDLTFNLKQGQLLGENLSSLTAEVSNLYNHKTSEVNIHAQLQSSLQKAMQFINEHAQQMQLHLSSLQELNLSGPMKLLLHLNIPLDDTPNNSQVDGQIDLQQSALEVPSFNVSCKNIVGTLYFKEKDLISDSLTGNCLDHLVNAKFQVEPKTKAQQIDISSLFTANDLTKAMPVFKQFGLEGQSLFHLLLTFPSFNSKIAPSIKAALSSTLQGIKILKPSFIAKDFNTALPINAEFPIKPADDSYPLFFQWGDQFSAAVLAKHSQNTWEIPKLALSFNQKLISLPKDPGLWIKGDLPRLKVDELQTSLSEFTNTISDNQHQTFKIVWPELKEINLNIKQFEILKYVLQNVYFKFVNDHKAWKADFNGPNIEGSILVPEMETTKDKQLMEAHFTHLKLQTIVRRNSEPLSFGKIKTENWPVIHLTLDDLMVDQRILGAIKLMARPMNKGFFIDNMTLKSPFYRMTATGYWCEKPQGIETQFKGDIESTDFATFLRAFDLTDFINNQKLQASFDLGWKGNPFDFAVNLLQGYVSIHAGRGSIQYLSDSVQKQNNLGRLLTLLSLESLPRRLSLNFSDLTQQDFSYEHLKGDIYLEAGKARTDNLFIRSLVADIKMQGEADLAKKEWDIAMNVTPHIMASAPAIAAIAGGPIAGAATYVAGKILTPAINQLTTRHFKITGSFNDPKIEKVSSQTPHSPKEKA